MELEGPWHLFCPQITYSASEGCSNDTYGKFHKKIKARILNLTSFISNQFIEGCSMMWKSNFNLRVTFYNSFFENPQGSGVAPNGASLRIIGRPRSWNRLPGGRKYPIAGAALALALEMSDTNVYQSTKNHTEPPVYTFGQHLNYYTK